MTRALAFTLTLALAPAAFADIEYRVDLSERSTHRARIDMTVRGAASPLELYMPSWTPGAYELRTWGRNVTIDGASDAAGRVLTARRTSPSTFRVEGHAAGAEVRLRYHVFAAQLSDDASQIGPDHAYLNGTSMFLGARGAERTSHIVSVLAPEGWRTATALDETPSGGFEAFSYEALVDAPIELGHFAEAEVRAAGRPYRIVIDGVREVPPQLVRDVASLAEAEARLAGTPPYRRYLVLLHLADGVGRIAALEHAASCSIVVPGRCLGGGDAYEELLYVIAHELFHAWNARRLRPAELVPYDFLKPVPSRSLWITEGLTEYFAHRAMYLAGRWTRARYFERISEEATRAAVAQRRNTTLEEDAQNAWQAPDDAAADPDAWYARGHLVAMALDARIRSESEGARALDDVLQALLARADKGGGVLALDPPGLERAVAEAAGEPVAQRLPTWTRLPREVERMPEVLAGLGLKLSLEEGPPRAHIGLLVEPDGGSLRVAAVLPASPAAHAGLRAGDRIVLLDGQAPTRKAFEQLADRENGTRIRLEAIRATRRMQMTLLLETVRPPVVRLGELAASPKTSALREAWLRR